MRALRLRGTPRVGVPRGRKATKGGTATAAPDTEAPTITSLNTGNNIEGLVLAHVLTANETVTWSIVGGADQLLFELSGPILRWASNGVQDYETPLDAGSNNTYVVQVRATDTALNTADQTITITVTDVDEIAPTITSSNAIDVDSLEVLSHTLTADESVTWTKTGGVDAGQFTLTTNVLTFTSPGFRDFDDPIDTGANNTYIVQVTATDTALNATNQTITFTIIEVGGPVGDAALLFNVDTNSMYVTLLDDPF